MVVILAGVVGYFALRKSATEPTNQVSTPANNQTPTPSLQTQTTDNVPTVSQSNSETASWKTYNNGQYGFEMKYPTSLIARDCYGSGILCLQFPTSSISIDIAVEGKPSVNLPGSFGGRYYFTSSSGEQPYSSQLITVNGISFTKELWLDYGGMGGGDNIINLYTERNGQYFTISMNREIFVGTSGEKGSMSAAERATYGQNDYYDKTFSQIISTFKFTK